MNPSRPRRFSDRLFQKFMRRAVEWQNRAGSGFMTVHNRPRRAAEIGTWPQPGIAPVRAAIAMQGPIYTDHDFTLETLRLYARQMPGVRLILSTWKDTDPALLAPIRDLGVTILLNEKPAYAGMFNVNMQITTAAAGVSQAVADGAEWVMKTRTDQRLYAPNVIPFLVALAHTFPVVGGLAQKYRILALGLGSLKFAPYHVTDQTLFGSAEDMLAYWTPPLRNDPPRDGWPEDAAGIYSKLPIGELCRYAAAESYFTSRFLERIGRPLDWTIVDTWAAYRDHFCFIDPETSDFYWVKGQTYSHQEHAIFYEALSNRTEFGFRDWLLLYGGQHAPEDARPYEAVLRDTFNTPVSAIRPP